MAKNRKVSAEDRRRARSELGWMLLFLAGLVVPIMAAAVPLEVSEETRVALVVVAVVLLDGVLVMAGARGRGAPGVVQPWRWSQYLFWLGVRSLMIVAVLLLTSG